MRRPRSVSIRRPPPRDKAIVAVDADSGRLLWKRDDHDTEEVMPTTLAVAAGRLFFQNTRQVVSLDASSGEMLWRAHRPVYTTRLSWSAPTLVACGDVVLSADGSTGGVPADARRGADAVEWIMSDTDIRRHPAGDLVAFCAKTGKRLWTSESLQGFCSPGDVFVIDGLVWAGANVAPGQSTLNVGLDLRTGEVKKRRTGDGPPVGGHARCYRDKATERHLVLAGMGVEFVDLADSSWTCDPWVRGTCQYGVMPANGLLYVPPDSCASPHRPLCRSSCSSPAPEGCDRTYARQRPYYHTRFPYPPSCREFSPPHSARQSFDHFRHQSPESSQPRPNTCSTQTTPSPMPSTFPPPSRRNQNR